MTDLVEFRPKVGALETPATKTNAYLMYNDGGIYFGGFCTKILRTALLPNLWAVMVFGTNDYIGIIFDTYNDKLNGFEIFYNSFRRTMGC